MPTFESHFATQAAKLAPLIKPLVAAWQGNVAKSVYDFSLLWSGFVAGLTT